MRKIKFRAWLDNKMEYDIAIDDGLGFIQIQKGNKITHKYTDKIMQFTGLKDKNGKEIYEGDIVTKGDNQPNYEVEYKDCAFQLLTKHYGYKLLSKFNEIEVVGNIHKNPEKTK